MRWLLPIAIPLQPIADDIQYGNRSIRETWELIVGNVMEPRVAPTGVAVTKTKNQQSAPMLVIGQDSMLAFT